MDLMGFSETMVPQIHRWSVWNYGSPLKSGKELRAETGRNSHEPRESGQKTKEIWYVWHFYLSMTLACYCRKHIPVLIMVLHILSMFYLYLVKVLEIIPWFWVNYDVSLTWIKVIWGWLPLLSLINHDSQGSGEQWGRDEIYPDGHTEPS